MPHMQTIRHSDGRVQTDRLSRQIDNPDLTVDLEMAYATPLQEYDPGRIDDFIDDAIENGHFGSERRLAEALGISPSNITNWRKRRSWPSDELMLSLADLGNRDPDEALLHLNYWRTECGNAKRTYLALLNLTWMVRQKVIAAAMLVLLSVGISPTPAQAAPVCPDQIKCMHYATF